MGKISARIFSLKKGYQSFSDLKSIRIKDKHYNLLIMEDYMPVIGEIDGNIVFVSDNSEIKLDNVEAYYRHSHNEFELLLKSEQDD